MTQTYSVGKSTGGKPINLAQLEAEFEAAGVVVSGLGIAEDTIFTYDGDGEPAGFPSAQDAVIDQVVADHVAMRDKTDAEYSAEFQDAQTTPERRQEIRDITAGLLPREQVPM